MRPETRFAVEGRGVRIFSLVAGVALVASVVASAIHPPTPIAHDEWAYLLAGDTFAHGRLANPTPAGWEALETMHVLLRPTYAAKYPPGQGLALALGFLFGRPMLGVWLANALAAGALAWMLDAWVRRPWPLVGGLVFALHPAVALGWSATYWGGAVAVLGAALAWGALPRVLLRGARGAGVALGVGAGLLAITRPFEGLVACLPLAFLFGAGFMQRRGLARGPLVRPLGLALCGLAPFVLLVLAHDRAVTGDALRLPYQEHSEQAEIVPVWLFGELREAPEYRHDALREFYTVSSAREFRERRTIEGFIRGLGQKLDVYGAQLVSWWWALLLLGLFVKRRDGRTRVLLWSAVLFALALAFETFEFTHYAAPFVPVGLALLLQGAERSWNVPRARSLVRPAVFVLGLAGFGGLAVRAQERAEQREAVPLARRGELERELLGLEKNVIDPVLPADLQLVFVRYGPGHNPHVEWVCNGAEPREQPVLWARSRGEQADRAFAELYPGRRAWLFEPDVEPLAPRPYLRDE